MNSEVFIVCGISVFAADYLIYFATLARERFKDATPEKRREFVAALSGASNLMLTNKTLSFYETTPLFIIHKAVKNAKEVKPTFEPLFDTTDKRKGHPLGVANS